MSAFKKAMLFYNPKSGQNRSSHQLSVICEHMTAHSIEFEIVNVPKSQNEIRQIVSQGITNNVDLFIAAGGDGTISLIGDPLISTGKPFGILPLGTGNLLAKTLNIPLKLEKALDLITSPNHKIIELDVLKVANDRNYVSNVSAGESPKLMASTGQQVKRRIGFFAYMIHFFQQALGLKSHRYYIEYDGQKVSFLANEILITNGRSIGLPHLEWPENIKVNDGILDILVIRARHPLDVFRLAISIFRHKEKQISIFKQFSFREYCRIASKSPSLVQADGDVIGKTPVEIRIVPQALKIIV
jgi:YegS/Rv2252/BmrU family lipid kinase